MNNRVKANIRGNAHSLHRYLCNNRPTKRYYHWHK